MEELQLSLLKNSSRQSFLFLGKKAIFLKKWWHHQKNVIALNMYIGTNILVYEGWLVLKVRYTDSHRLTLAYACESKMINFNHVLFLTINWPSIYQSYFTCVYPCRKKLCHNIENVN